MGYPIEVAVRYLGSKKRASISVGTAFAILGVALGVAALATVMSVTGGFQKEFREKVLGVTRTSSSSSTPRTSASTARSWSR